MSNVAIRQCQIVNNKNARIYFSSTGAGQIDGSIYPFENPKSNREQNNIRITLRTASGSQKTGTFFGTISNFDPSSLAVTLKSSSNEVGA